MKIIPDTCKKHCQKGEIPEITQENTDEHDVGPDRVPGPGALSGRTQENFITTYHRGNRTDGPTGNKSAPTLDTVRVAPSALQLWML